MQKNSPNHVGPYLPLNCELRKLNCDHSDVSEMKMYGEYRICVSCWNILLAEIKCWTRIKWQFWCKTQKLGVFEKMDPSSSRSTPRPIFFKKANSWGWFPGSTGWLLLLRQGALGLQVKFLENVFYVTYLYICRWPVIWDNGKSFQQPEPRT